MLSLQTCILLLFSFPRASGGDVGDTRQHLSRHIRSDDVSLYSLVVTVQQQSAIITSLQADLNAEKARTSAALSAVEADLGNVKSKVASLSKTVAFTARFSTDNLVDGVVIGNSAPLRFDSVPFNSGNGYDPQTGMFTAPVSGTYGFFVVAMGTGNHGFVDLFLGKNGAVLDVIYAQDNTDQGSGLVMSHVAAGERVWVRHETGNAVRGQWYTYFTGFLIHAD